MSKPATWALTALALSGLLAASSSRPSEQTTLEITAFQVQHSLVVKASPEEAFDAFTGDISGWWDHSYSKPPRSLVIEPFPGGHFIEYFGASTDGALHATVTLARRGETLHFTGPLGFMEMGQHFDMVHRLDFEAAEGGTRLTMRVTGLGTIQPGWEQAVQGVWHHFLDERFKPFVEGTL
jgi:hypothetical protein